MRHWKKSGRRQDTSELMNEDERDTHSSGEGFRPLCLSLFHCAPRIGCSFCTVAPSTSVVCRNASKGWSRKNCLRISSSTYLTGSGFVFLLSAGGVSGTPEGVSNRERDGGARAGRGKGGLSRTARYQAGSRWM